MNIERSSMPRRVARALLIPGKLADWHRHIACYSLAFSVISAWSLYPVLENYLTASDYFELVDFGFSRHPLKDGVELLTLLLLLKSLMYSLITGVRLSHPGFWLFFLLELSAFLLLTHFDGDLAKGAEFAAFLLFVRWVSQLLFLLFQRTTGLPHPGKRAAFAYTATLALGSVAIITQVGSYAYGTHKHQTFRSAWESEAIGLFDRIDRLHDRVYGTVEWEAMAQTSDEVKLEKLKYDCPYRTGFGGLFIERPGVFYAVGGQSTILRVDANHGSSICDSHFSKGYLQDIQFYDGFGVAVGPHMIKYSDDGRMNDWHRYSPLVPRKSRHRHILKRHNKYYDVEFISRNKGFLTANDALLVTTDGGQTWHRSDVGLPESERVQLQALSFVDEKTGWVVGSDGVIFHTADGGDTWTDLGVEDKTVHFISVFFIDRENGFAGTTNGFGQTTDGGKTWSATRKGRMHDIFFVDESHGVMATRFGATSYLAYTRDGGANWSYVELAGDFTNFWEVALESQRVGYIVGEDGHIFRFTIYWNRDA